jgi:hypothetical protein
MNEKYRRLLNTTLIRPEDKASIILVAEGLKDLGDVADRSFMEDRWETYIREKPRFTIAEDIVRRMNLLPFRIYHIKKNEINGTRIVNGYMDIRVVRNERLIKKFKSFRLDDRIVGGLYGYPPCCIEAYLTREYSPLPNLNKGDIFVFHRVCSTNCQESIKLSMAYKGTLDSVAPGLVQQVIERGLS